MNRVRVQIRDGKTEIVVAPDQVAVLDAIAQEFFLAEKCADTRMLRLPQKRPEVDDLLDAVIELQTQAVTPHVLGVGHVDDGRVHGSGLVIFSVEKDLWSTK
jgi:hypothetical protein